MKKTMKKTRICQWVIILGSVLGGFFSPLIQATDYISYKILNSSSADVPVTGNFFCLHVGDKIPDFTTTLKEHGGITSGANIEVYSKGSMKGKDCGVKDNRKYTITITKDATPFEYNVTCHSPNDGCTVDKPDQNTKITVSPFGGDSANQSFEIKD